jgi:hypothetical protein
MAPFGVGAVTRPLNEGCISPITDTIQSAVADFPSVIST